jgi:hypothetical protein
MLTEFLISILSNIRVSSFLTVRQEQLQQQHQQKQQALDP